jgi:hypothetical protein
MTGTTGPADQSPSAKQAAAAVIEKQPRDASFDEIVDALWAWGMTEPADADACSAGANRMLALNPAELVMANRAARDAAILGMSRQIALEVVQGLPEPASVDDILVAVATWHWPDDATD